MSELRQIKIRRAGPADADRLAEFAARTFHQTFAATNRADDLAAYLAGAFGPTQQLAEIAAPNTQTFLAMGHDLLAFAQLRNNTPPPCVRTADPIELWRFYVDQAWHGRGLAGRLMRVVLAEAAQAGAGSVWLGVWEHNARAAAFYRKCGFAPVGSHDFQLGTDRQTDEVMVLKLSS